MRIASASIFLLVISIAPWAAQAEESAQFIATRDAVIAAYAFGDHALAFDVASRGAQSLASEPERRVMESFLANLRKKSEEGYIALGPAGIKRLDAVRSHLKTTHRLDKIDQDDLRWAIFGDGRPYILDDARAAMAENATDVHWLRALRRYEAATSSLTADDTLLIWFEEQDVWRLNHMADIAKKMAARQTLTDLEAQFATDNRRLRPLYLKYVKAGGPDVAAERAAEKAVLDRRTEKDRLNNQMVLLRSKRNELLAEKSELESAESKLRLRLRRVAGIKSEAAASAKAKLEAEIEASEQKLKAVEARLRDNQREHDELERTANAK